MLTLKEIKKYAKDYMLELLEEEWQYTEGHKEYNKEPKHCICTGCNRVWGASRYKELLIDRISKL